MDYFSVYDRMQNDKVYTAAELGMAPASMTAMFRRGLVERIEGKPMKYKKVKSKLYQITKVLNKHPSDFFILYKKDAKLGMLCQNNKGNILDCYGNKYDLTEVNKIEVNTSQGSISFEID